MTRQRAVIEEEVFSAEERVPLDNREFLRCTVKGSTLVFSGGELPLMKDCVFDGISFDFEGPADKTVQFFRWLKIVGGQHVIEAFLTMNPKKMH